MTLETFSVVALSVVLGGPKEIKANNSEHHPSVLGESAHALNRSVPVINPFASIGPTGTSNIFLLESTGRRTGTLNEKSMSKVSLYISRNVISFFFLLWF